MIGLSHTSILLVQERDTALRQGSGDMPVLATPCMMALMENAAMLAVAPVLDNGQTTVGSAISSSHLRPTGVGKTIKAVATLTAQDGRRLTFTVSAYEQTAEGDVLLGEGTHQRVIVSRERFLQKV